MSDRIWTLPNLLCVIRLFGSIVLVGLAVADRPRMFLGWFLVLAFTDWIDGKLAIWLNQRSAIGPRLDSWADAALYSALLLGGLWLRGQVLAQELVWILPALASYAVTTLVGLWKFGRWPSYHTRAAKTCWFLVMVSAATLFTDWSLWPLRITMVAVLLTNLEATLITCVLDHWRSDVPSLLHVRRRQE